MQTEAQPTRTRILNAAREIFSENGFHSASMKAICKSCAISPGTLYHHFISKEALIQAIILQDQERALARFREPIEYWPISKRKTWRVKRRLLRDYAR